MLNYQVSLSSPSALGGQRSRVAHAAVDPALELALRAHPLRVDAQPSVHHATAHLERPRVGLALQLLRLCWVAAQHQPALPADADGHVSADQKREAAEHALSITSISAA